MNRFLARKPRNVGISLPRILSQRFFATVVKDEAPEGDLDIASLEQQTVLPEIRVGGLTEEEIEQKRNKSRLLPGDRNVTHNSAPQIDVVQRFHSTVKYKRRIFGRYGMDACDVPLGIAWPTKEQVEDFKEWEAVAYPQTVQEMMKTIAENRRNEAEQIRARDETIAQNVQKLDKWIHDMKVRVAKKEAEAIEARQRKERLIEEVRRHFGFQMSPKDQRFKDMLAQKDKEDKKKKKVAKKQAREQKMMAMFAETADAVRKREAANKAEESKEMSKEPMPES